ncbi:MAG TPA: enoyl-CoA hydratase [Geminicoccaceae bacterium]|nr:enoyl-CoA hydratase [Geminicoccaceae bacterium]
MADAADVESPAVDEAPAAEAVLLRSDAEGVVGLTLNRPDQYNALSRELLGLIQRELDAIKDDPGVRVVVITGSGRAFCAGHDLKEIATEREREKLLELFGACSRMMLSLTRLPQPVIALIDGIATAAGCQLVAACDLALATSNARFATSGIKYGLFCSTPMVAVARNVPRKSAMEMLLSGDFIEAEDALRLGLVNQVVAPEKLEEAFDALVARLLDKPPEVLALGKRAFYRQLEMGLEDAYAFTTEVIVDNALGKDFEEGLAAFLEKRAPVWPSGAR